MEVIATLITNIVMFLVFFACAVLTIVLATYFIRQLLISHLYKKKLVSAHKQKNFVVLLVKISPSNESREDAMENFLRSIHRVLPNGTTISLEMVSSDQFLNFYITVAPEYRNVVESQLYAQYPDSEIDEAQDVLSGMQQAVFAEIGFKHSSIYPLKTYQEFEEDILKSVSALLSKTEPGEKVFWQIVLKRIGGKMRNRPTGFYFHSMFGSKSADTKLPHDLFLGKLRVGYSAPDRNVAQAKIAPVLALFKVVKSARNELRKKRTASHEIFKAASARLFKQGDLWTISEIVTIYHFPYKGGLVSNVVHTDSKRAPAPDILPREDLAHPEDVSIFGETNYRNEHRRFGIKRFDRRRHLYVVGKTGSGKSKLLQLLLIADVQNGKGCCLIDPHGDLAKEILKYIPKERINDVIYVDPSERNFPIPFNPLEPVADYEQRQHLATFFIAIFKKLFAANWNPRLEHIIRYVTLALLETPDSNILGIQRMLTDTAFRQRVIKQIQDPVVKSFWTTEYAAWNERFSSEAITPLLNKVGQFIANPIIRNMVGQRENALKFDKFMNEGKIVIINVSKGKLGEENASLLGSMFITKIQQGALARADIPEDERRDFYFYVDEFQNFATDAFSSILSEARKYHLDLTIAHQYIAQLPEDVKATAFGNVGSLVVFAVGGDDARYLSSEFAPVFSAEDMIRLNTREMYIKMSVDGKLTPPFSARTIAIPPPQFDYSQEILKQSQLKYGKNRIAVENEIKKWTDTAASTVSETSSAGDFPEPII